MAYRFELVSPERRLASQEVTAVRIPGADGDLTAMAGHTPVIASLRPGLLTLEGGAGEETFAVTGGFAEIGAESCTVLAERALPRGEVDQGTYGAWLSDARRAHDEARERGADGDDDAVTSAAKLVEDMVAMGGHIGLDPNQPNL